VGGQFLNLDAKPPQRRAPPPVPSTFGRVLERSHRSQRSRTHSNLSDRGVLVPGAACCKYFEGRQQARQSRRQAAPATHTTSCHPLRLFGGSLNARVALQGPGPARNRAIGAFWFPVTHAASTTRAASKRVNLDAKLPLRRAPPPATPPTFWRVLERSRCSPRPRTSSYLSDGGCLVPGAARGNDVGGRPARASADVTPTMIAATFATTYLRFPTGSLPTNIRLLRS
jgi:hypothetical protein